MYSNLLTGDTVRRLVGQATGTYALLGIKYYLILFHPSSRVPRLSRISELSRVPERMASQRTAANQGRRLSND